MGEGSLSRWALSRWVLWQRAGARARVSALAPALVRGWVWVLALVQLSVQLLLLLWGLVQARVSVWPWGSVCRWGPVWPWGLVLEW